MAFASPAKFLKSLSKVEFPPISSHPSIFTSTNLSIPAKPIEFQPLSLSSFSSHKKRNQLSSIISLVAQNPDAQFVIGEEGEEEDLFWENQEFDESGAPISDLEGEGEDSALVDGLEDIGVAEVDDDDDDDVVVYSKPVSEEAKLYVGNLPYDFDHQGLSQLFDQAGTVEIAEVIYNRETNQSRGFGFVTMSTVKEAEVAVEKLHGHTVNGRTLTVNKAAARGTQAERFTRFPGPAINLYVGNLSWDVDSSQLEQIFSEHGNVVEARVISDRETGRSRGFGFVTMSTESEMNDAIAALDGKSVNGRPIRVNVAEEKPKQSVY